MNLLIIDDPHKDRADAESEASRRALHEWHSSTALKRLQPDRNAIVRIQTRWHPGDWAGRRLADEGQIEGGGKRRVSHLPAIADPKFGRTCSAVSTASRCRTRKSRPGTRCSCGPGGRT
ncbi:hypothetical protein [Streptomyces sp. NPDC091040]|uniref:hypothetical protein n=1 Tax=Streptomyces sp. NPDC091040 TaxID=3365972 RepID=UPI0038123D17